MKNNEFSVQHFHELFPTLGSFVGSFYLCVCVCVRFVLPASWRDRRLAGRHYNYLHTTVQVAVFIQYSFDTLKAYGPSVGTRMALIKRNCSMTYNWHLLNAFGNWIPLMRRQNVSRMGKLQMDCLFQVLKPALFSPSNYLRYSNWFV